MALSFTKDIRPLFRDTPDVDTMKDFGLEIYATLLDGSMPCDEPWPKEQTARFKQWMDEGMAA